jgi:hypothetical protein
MNDDRLTEVLAAKVLGWRVAPGRFIKPGRSWIPRWRFQPLTELPDAFQLLDHVAEHYTLTQDGVAFTADVHTVSRRVVASGESKARTITLAVARALGLEVDS